MKEPQNENQEKTGSENRFDYSSEKGVIFHLTYSFDDLLDSVREIDPDFPEEYLRTALEFVEAGENDELESDDFKPGGRFAPEIINPVRQALKDLLLNHMEFLIDQKSENFNFDDSLEEKDRKSSYEDIDIPGTAETFREINPDFKADYLTMITDYWQAQVNNELKPEDYQPGGRFEEKKLYTAAKALYIALFGEDEFEKNKDRLSLKDLTDLVIL